MSFRLKIHFNLEKFRAVKILKKYIYVTKLADNELLQCGHSDRVWTMWLQDEVPEICQMCLNSIKKYYPDAIVITEKNLNEYVEIPSGILEKYKSGKMLPAHFSDLVRMCLLDKYGGTWIDATCYLTQPIPSYIRKSPFFILRSFGGNALSNYFIHSDSNNYLTKCIKYFLLEYWKHENKACYYFMFHLFILKVLIKKNLKAKELYNHIPIGLNWNTKIFYEILFNDFDKDIYDFMCQTSYLHKFTYKNIQNRDNNPNSFYRYLLKEDTKVSS